MTRRDFQRHSRWLCILQQSCSASRNRFTSGSKRRFVFNKNDCWKKENLCSNRKLAPVRNDDEFDLKKISVVRRRLVNSTIGWCFALRVTAVRASVMSRKLTWLHWPWSGAGNTGTLAIVSLLNRGPCQIVNKRSDGTTFVGTFLSIHRYSLPRSASLDEDFLCCCYLSSVPVYLFRCWTRRHRLLLLSYGSLRTRLLFVCRFNVSSFLLLCANQTETKWNQDVFQVLWL